MLPPHSDDGPKGDRESQIEALAKQAAALSQGVADLVEGTGTAIVGLAKRGQSTRRWVTLLGVSLVLDVLLTLAFTYIVTQVEGTSHRVDGLSSNTRNQLCGMLQIFVNSDTPQSAAIAKARGDDMAARTHSFALIRHSYNALECAKLVK